MPMSATKEKDGSHAQWCEMGLESQGGEEVEIKEAEATVGDGGGEEKWEDKDSSGEEATPKDESVKEGNEGMQKKSNPLDQAV